MILADQLAVIFDNRNPRVVLRFPVFATVDIKNRNLESAVDQEQQFLDQLLTKMTPPPAKYRQGFQIADPLPVSRRRCTDGKNRRRQGVCRNRQRPIVNPTVRPASAATAAAASPSDKA